MTLAVAFLLGIAVTAAAVTAAAIAYDLRRVHRRLATYRRPPDDGFPPPLETQASPWLQRDTEREYSFVWSDWPSRARRTPAGLLAEARDWVASVEDCSMSPLLHEAFVLVRGLVEELERAGRDRCGFCGSDLRVEGHRGTCPQSAMRSGRAMSAADIEGHAA